MSECHAQCSHKIGMCGGDLPPCAIESLKDQKSFTDNESMPCEIGVYDEPCKLGFPCKCKHSCLIRRTVCIEEN